MIGSRLAAATLHCSCVVVAGHGAIVQKCMGRGGDQGERVGAAMATKEEDSCNAGGADGPDDHDRCGG